MEQTDEITQRQSDRQRHDMLWNVMECYGMLGQARSQQRNWILSIVGVGCLLVPDFSE